MTHKKFTEILKEIIEEIKTKDLLKKEEYTRNDDRFHNFRMGAFLLDTTIPEYIITLRSKHEISILDMVNDMRQNRFYPLNVWKEKITDSILYLILLYAYISDFYEDMGSR